MKKQTIKMLNTLKCNVLSNGLFIDLYNESVSNTSGTILARYNARNEQYILQEMNRNNKPINTDEDGNSKCIRASYFKAGSANLKERKDGYSETGVKQDFGIRKLTERECFRLMGVKDSDIDLIQQAGISKSQQYKMAGNSIVCDVLEAIFRKMFVNTEPEKGQQLTIF